MELKCSRCGCFVLESECNKLLVESSDYCDCYGEIAWFIRKHSIEIVPIASRCARLMNTLIIVQNVDLYLLIC